MQEQYVNFAYYTNKLIEGSRTLATRSYRTMRKHFKETAEEHARIMKEVEKGNEYIDV